MEIVKDNQNNLAQEQADFKEANERLYKQNLELAVRNKTLSLLRQLYQISILTLEPNILVGKLAETIQKAFEFELVAFFSLDEKEDSLLPMQFAQSSRWESASVATKIPFLNFPIKGALHTNVLKNKKMVHTENISDIWPNITFATALTEFQHQVNVRGLLEYPLIVGGGVFGVVVFALNRKYEDMIQFEKESIDSFIDVIAIALDRSRLYQQLQIANKDLAVSNDRLKELDQLKSEFLSFASHQIRSPLTAIGGYTSMLLEGDYGEMPEKIRDSVKVIDTSSQSLIKIVNEFLDISRIEQGRMKYEVVDFDAKNLTEEVVVELRPNVEKKGLTLEFSADAGDYAVSSDMGKIKQVIGNVIDNSIKYTPHGSVKVHVERRADKILISITDTGIGISKEDIPKLFSKFTRAKDANKTNVSGTGLGLYVAKQMLEALHGKIWVESPGQGKGSTFFIELRGKK